MTTPEEFLADADSPLQTRTNEGMVVERTNEDKIRGEQFAPLLDPDARKPSSMLVSSRVRWGSTI